MTTTRCARFPNLYPSPGDARNTITKRTLAAFDTSEEILYRAWARVLRAYAGEDGGVSFRCEHGIVTVESSESDLRYGAFDESRNGISRDQTGVYVDSVSGNSNKM
jgi:hypothetical protein